ncbi:conserved hypothetical protein [Histoplasma capsulatum var. duboisii H88]|uniref:Spo12 family protein n=2 Tax=Ajellomyces capsulatus TaxID=5037 RepID=F0USJ9_AJEC8|nr:conserved hypothetical protein [Histoplasma capsulatum H143]EGC48876.1 conserved hypothetical protein [Histoplasma capsulatum var. duboisii H88]QSS54480.1 Spo12 family protein [Histoplasma capsulatum var. duboisii H88]
MELNPTSPSKTTPLADRSTNILLSNTVPAGVAPPMTTGDCSADLKAATVTSMEYHRQVLKEKLENGKSEKGHYISPSDGIMSPCTKKLSDLKGKRYKNAGKPQTLFAKAISKKPVEKKDES